MAALHAYRFRSGDAAAILADPERHVLASASAVADAARAGAFRAGRQPVASVDVLRGGIETESTVADLVQDLVRHDFSVRALGHRRRLGKPLRSKPWPVGSVLGDHRNCGGCGHRRQGGVREGFIPSRARRDGAHRVNRRSVVDHTGRRRGVRPSRVLAGGHWRSPHRVDGRRARPPRPSRGERVPDAGRGGGMHPHLRGWRGCGFPGTAGRRKPIVPPSPRAVVSPTPG